MEGRVAILKTIISGCKIAFVSVYAPSTFDPMFFPNLTRALLELSEYKLVMGMDANAVIKAADDRSSRREVGSQKHASLALRRFMSDLSLIDLYRFFKPNSKEFTFFSNRHKTYSRIDYILVSNAISSKFTKAEIWPAMISDHSSVFGKFCLVGSTQTPKRWRFNITLLQNADFCTKFLSELDDFLSFNEGSVDDPRILWDAIKGFIVSFSTSFSSHLKKSKLAKISELEGKIATLERQLQQEFSDSKAQTLQTVRIELGALLRQRAEFMIQRSRRNYYFNGAIYSP